MRLTALQIDKLPIPTQGQKTYWEGDGFGIRVSQGGSKSFVVVYGPDRRLKTLGRYPAMSLKTARREAQIQKLTDTPNKHLERTDEAILAFLEDCERRVRPRTVQGYADRLKKLDSAQLSDISLRSIPNTPQHIAAVKAFLNWCVRMEYIDRHAFTFTKAKFGQRDRVLTNEELRAIWHYDFPPYSDYLKLLILTGQRRGQFQNYELREDSIYFPPEAMKAGVAHTLPLTAAVRAMLPIPPYNGWGNGKRRIDRHVPLAPWVVHDLRRTFSTNCAALGIPLHVTEEILAHRSGQRSGVARIYNRHHYQSEMREALDRLATHVQAVVA
ncbi:MAG: integrase family protein [Pseudomonadota bacterium]